MDSRGGVTLCRPRAAAEDDRAHRLVTPGIGQTLAVTVAF
jgi:hypothetical protein